MKALTVRPRQAASLELREISEPTAGSRDLLCEIIAVGICGTDQEIAHGDYGKSPEGQDYLVIGHESLGRVLKAPLDSKSKPGDLVVGIVRRPDPVPCSNCAVDEWDMCRNGRYEERGISGLHGFASDRYVLEEAFAVKLSPDLKTVGVLLEPTSVVAKAWEQCERIAARSAVPPTRALITGAGPVGLLAAMIGRQKGYEIHVLDQVTAGLKPELVSALGATYHNDFSKLEAEKLEFGIILECTGAPALVFALLEHMTADGILCLAGISSGVHEFPLDVSDFNRRLVLGNEVIFGSVNANRRHYEAGVTALENADRAWLERLITRKVPLDQWTKAFEKGKDDIKTVLVANPVTTPQ